MEEKLLKYFESKKRGVSISQILEDFDITTYEEKTFLCDCLKELEKKAYIYVDKLNNYMLFPKKINLVQGKILKNSKGKFYIIDEPNIYLNEYYLNGALEGDTVLVIKDTFTTSDKVLGKVKKIISRNPKHFIFECKIVNFKKVLVPINFELYENISIPDKVLDNLVDGSRVLVKLSEERVNGHFLGSVVKEIGHKDDPDIKVKEIVTSNGADIDFSKEALAELDKIPNLVSEEETIGRLDLRNEEIFTIDSESTKDIDDAISLKMNERGNYVLGVHIADVSHYVKPGSKLFEEAIERANSIYALDYVVPMLPHKLSNGICSLNESADRLTKSCIMEIDPTGQIIDYKICNSVIRSKKKMTYEDVNKILDENIVPEGYETFVETLRLMNELSSKIDIKKIKSGRLDFCENELRAIKDSDGKIVNINQITRGSGEHLIENFMVAANETVASNYSSLPFVYRIHDVPKEEILEKVFDYIRSLKLNIRIPNNITNPKVIQKTLFQIKKLPIYPILSDLILRGMSKAMYDTTNIGHFALASESYTHFTSPIRRINDLVVHCLIDLYSNNFSVDKLDDLQIRLKEICVNASKMERVAEDIERQVINMAIVEFLKNNEGKSFNATIIDINSKYVTVKLDNGIRGNLNIKGLSKIGYSFRANSNTLKCNNDILTLGSNIIVTVSENCLSNNRITFNMSNKKSKQLVKKLVI